jgi:hypothetical protein
MVEAGSHRPPGDRAERVSRVLATSAALIAAVAKVLWALRQLFG